MESNQWDPLENTLPNEILIAAVKRQIKNILKSYTGWYDLLSELIQNALDAVDDRKKIDKEYKPIIDIEINLKENLICVTDNGIGFTEDQFRSFLAPNVSFKPPGNRGSKGVGATYLAYGFNFIQIGTKSPDFQYVGTLKGGREWVEDDSGVKTRPKVQAAEALHSAFESIDRGSTFCLKLVGDFIRPKDLTWVGASSAEQWEIVLKVKTPLGGIYLNGEYGFPDCHLSVIDEAGNKTERQLPDCEYIYPHKVISACKGLDGIKEIQKDLIEKGKDPGRLPDSCYRLNGLYNYWNYEDFISGEFKGLLDENDTELAAKYKLSSYGFFCYSTDIWDKYNDEILGLRKGARILKGGIQIATNSMPQGELVMIPLTRNIGYQNVTHVVVHFYGADPDLGRKGFQPELVELAKRVGAGIAQKFLGWRRLLKKETGAPPDIIEDKNIYDWIKEQEVHESNRPLIIKRKDVFLPIAEPSLTSEPLYEQDVVALFNQLLAGGVIRGIKLMASSEHKQYDGVFKFVMQKPFEYHLYDKEKNPLGVERSRANDEYISSPKILEYKYSFDALLEEMEKGVKSEKQIDLVIAWEMGHNWQKRYEITPLLHPDNLHHRYFHGGTHIIKSSLTGDRVFPAIIVSELIAYINDPDEVQGYQKATYME